MAQDASTVSVGKPRAAGGVYRAPAGTAAPTDATTALSAAFVNLGFVTDEGLVNSISSDEATINAWGGTTVLVINTSRDERFTFAFLQTDVNVLRVVYGEQNVTEEDGTIVVRHNAQPLEEAVWVFEILLTGNRVKRIVVEKGKPVNPQDVTYVDGEAISYGVELAAAPTAAGDTAIEYIAALGA